MRNGEVIGARVQSIRENVRLLRQLQGMTLEELAADPWRSGSAKYFVQTAIEGVLDICKYLVAQAQESMPEKHRDLPMILSKQGMLPRDFALRLGDMIGMRNVLVHGYLQVDLAKVHKVLTESLDDFDTFAQYIVDYLDRESIS